MSIIGWAVLRNAFLNAMEQLEQSVIFLPKLKKKQQNILPCFCITRVKSIKYKREKRGQKLASKAQTGKSISWYGKLKQNFT